MKAPSLLALLVVTLLTNIPASQSIMLCGGVTHTYVSEQLSDGDVATLGSHDLIVFIDQSGSMNSKDCYSFTGQKISRWDWCREQTTSLTNQLSPLAAANITLIPFNKEYRVYEHVQLSQIADIFDNNKPEGGTYLTEALQGQIESFFSRKATYGKLTKPLVLAIITDGAPKNPGSLEHLIAQSANRIDNASDLSLVFIQIGHDGRGTSLLQQIPSTLGKYSPHTDIVSIRMFDEVQQRGLARTLVQALGAKDKS